MVDDLTVELLVVWYCRLLLLYSIQVQQDGVAAM
jgi:hypothetical protein